MADIKLSALTTTTAITTSDLIVCVTSAAGTPTDKLINKELLIKGNYPNAGRAAFLAVLSTFQTITDKDVTAAVTFDFEIFDQTSNFAANVFTAPIAGRYKLDANLVLSDIDNDATRYDLRIKTSNRQYLNYFSPKLSADPPFHTLCLSVVADMDAADTAWAVIYQNGGTTQSYIRGATGYNCYSYFSGCLLC